MEVRKFVSRGGIRVYGMPVEAFPGHVNNIYPVSAPTLQVSRNRYRPLCFLCSEVLLEKGAPTGRHPGRVLRNALHQGRS